MRRAIVATIVIISILFSAYVPRVSAFSQPTQYSLNVTGGTVSVSINLNMVQNVTSFESSFVLPRVHVSAVGPNSTDLANILQSALQLKNPRARVNNLSLQVGSSAWLNATSLQWLNESLSFDVSGVSKSQGGAVQVDMSWKSFAVSSGYSLGGVEVNQIGEGYLVKVATDLAAVTGNSQIFRFFYLVNGKNVDPAQFPNAVTSISVLNFSSFAIPTSKWRQTYVPLASTQSWSFVGARGLGMVFLQEVQEGGSTTRTEYGLFYDLAGSITAASGARVVGDTVTLVVSELIEALMAGIIVTTVVLWSGTTLFERRVQRKVWRKKARG